MAYNLLLRITYGIFKNFTGKNTQQEAVRVYTASGREQDEKHTKNMLSQWKKRGYIDGDSDKGYTKR